MEKKETGKAAALLAEANQAKDILMKIKNELEEIGCDKKATALGNLLWKLEAWQHGRIS